MAVSVVIIYINVIPFMMMMSRAIHFGTGEMIYKKGENHHDIIQTNYEEASKYNTY